MIACYIILCSVFIVSYERIVMCARLLNSKKDITFKDVYNKCSEILSMPFGAAYDFISVSFGFFLTVGVVLLGLIAFIALSIYTLPYLAGFVLIGAVLGSFAVAAIGGSLLRCGLFGGQEGDANYNSLDREPGKAPALT